MTSIERHEQRYQRRKTARKQRKIDRVKSLGNISEIFSYQDLFDYGKKCCNGVRYKQSTQNFEAHLFSRTAVQCYNLKNNLYKPKPNHHFTLIERGKVRPIDAPHINDRQVQKTLTKNVLYPLYSPSMIYDNGASIKGKGLHFSYKRLKMHLHNHYKKYGTEGYIILIDLKSYFPSAPHNQLIQRHEELLINSDLCNLTNKILKLQKNGIGVPLGVEPSQLEMVALPSKIDNFIKCQLHEKNIGHFMDDYYIIVDTKERAQYILSAVEQKFLEFDIKLNKKKSYIQPIRKPFRYCKCKFILTSTGKIITHGCRASMKHNIRKLKLFKREHRDIKEVKQWMKIAKSYYDKFNDHGRILKLNRLFYTLFKEELEN